MRHKPKRQGLPSEIVKLDIHSWTGKILSRTKSKTTEKEKGVLMISQIMDYFNISMDDYKESIENVLIAEAIDQRGISQSPEPLKLYRDEKGNLASPFASKKRLV